MCDWKAYPYSAYLRLPATPPLLKNQQSTRYSSPPGVGFIGYQCVSKRHHLKLLTLIA